jgi:hypothetical protein
MVFKIWTNATNGGNHSLSGYEPTTLEGFIGQLWEKFAPNRNHTGGNITVDSVSGQHPRMLVPLTGQKSATGGSEKEGHANGPKLSRQRIAQ